MAKIFDILKDPDFQKLSYSDKKGVLSHFDQSFSQLGPSDQDVVMKHFNLNQPSPAPDEVQPVQKAASDIYTPALVTLGGIAGGAAGGAAGIPTGPGAAATAVGGSALGMAGGLSAAHGIDRMIGLKPPIENAGQALQSTAQDITSGLGYEAGGQLAGAAIKNVLSPMASKIGESGKALIDKAKSMGIDLTPAEVIRSKSLSLLESVMDNLPFAGEYADKFHLKQAQELVKKRESLLRNYGSPEEIEILGSKIQQQVDDAVREHAKLNSENMLKLKDRLLYKLGSTQTYEEAGMAGQEALAKFSKDKFEHGSSLYDDVAGFINPENKINPENYRKEAIRLLSQEKASSEALQDPQVISLLEDISGKNKISQILKDYPADVHGDVLKNIDPEEVLGMNWEGLSADRRRLGQLIADSDSSYGFSRGAKGTKFVSNNASGVYKKLFEALDKDMSGMVDAAGPEARNALEMARLYWGESKQLYGNPFITRMARTDPDKVVNMVFKPGAINQIRMTRRAIGPESFDDLARSFTNKLMETPEGVHLTADVLSKRINKYGVNTIEEIYGDKAKDIIDFPQMLQTANPELKNNVFFNRILKTDPQKVVDSIIRPENTSNADKLVGLLGEKAKKSVSEGFFSKILQDMASNSQGDFSPTLLNSTLNKYGEQTLSKWLPKDALKDLKDFAEVSTKIPRAASLGSNPSGTGRVVIGALGGGYFLYNPKKALKIAVPAAILAKLYFSPSGRQYLMDGFNTALTSPESQKVFSKLASSALSLIDKESEE